VDNLNTSQNCLSVSKQNDVNGGLSGSFSTSIMVQAASSCPLAFVITSSFTVFAAKLREPGYVPALPG
jgi:hypothetical protein